MQVFDLTLSAYDSDDYADAIYKCSQGKPENRATCSGNAIKKVFNSLVPLLAGR